TVGPSKKCLNESSTWNTARRRDSSCVANNECPPNAKKLSSTPTGSMPSRDCQISAILCSTSFVGARYALSELGRKSVAAEVLDLSWFASPAATKFTQLSILV